MSEGVSILIPTHNRCDILDRTLASLNGLSRPPGVEVEVIVVANVCTDRTAEVVRSWIPRSQFPLRLVEETALGLNNARNRACREARYDIFAFLDDDVLVDADWLTGLLESFRSTGASMLGGKVELWWEAVQRPAWMIPDLEVHLSRLDLGDKEIRLNEATVVGANFALRRQVFEDAGTFRPDLDRKGKSLISGGETDFINRAFAKGHQLWYTPRASLRHWVPPHRAELGHLLGIIAGKSASFPLMMTRYGPVQAARSVLGGTRCIARTTLRLWSANLRGKPEEALRARMGRAVGIGQLRGCYLRLRGGT